MRRNATVLFDTYLGIRTGRQVLDGLTHRGDGEDIRAAILYCDLRNSTALQQSLSSEAYLDLLNTFFEQATEPILAAGGEVLKYIGDAVLAIFPLEGDDTDDETTSIACRRARETAQEIVSRIATMSVGPDHTALLTLLPDPGPGGKLNTDLEGRDDKADEAAIFAGIQGTVGCPAVGAGCDA